MRKLGIAIAVGAVAVVGFAPNAFAAGHEGSLCPPIQGLADQTEADPINPVDNPGTPVKQILQGGADACMQSDPLQVVCGVANGVEAMIPEASQLTDAIQGPTCGAAPTGDDDDDDDGTKNEKKDNDDPAVEDEVVENNAAPGGTLPRTGGEMQLLGGLSMGLTGLGVFARRFLK